MVSDKAMSLHEIHFSIVTVVKDDLEGLKRTRKSIEKQSFLGWTHVVVNGSRSVKIKNFLNTLPKKNTIAVSESDTGIYDAMNKGWFYSPDESYIFYLNARDEFATHESLEEAAKVLLLHESPLWGCTTHEELEEGGGKWVCKLVSPPNINNQLYAFGYRSHQAVVMKKELIKVLGGFNEKYRIASDWDLIVRAMRYCEPVEWIHPLGKFYLGGISSQKESTAQSELRQIREEFLLNSKSKYIFDDLWCSIFLRYIDYKNIFTPFILLLFGANSKMSQRFEKRKMFTGNRIRIPFFIFVIQISLNSDSKLNQLFRFLAQALDAKLWKLRNSLVIATKVRVLKLLNRRLQVLEYSAPKITKK